MFNVKDVTMPKKHLLRKQKPKLAAALLAASGAVSIASSIIIGAISFSKVDPLITMAIFGTGVVVGVAELASGLNVYTTVKADIDKWATVAMILLFVNIPSLFGLGIGAALAIAGAVIAYRHNGKK